MFKTSNYKLNNVFVSINSVKDSATDKLLEYPYVIPLEYEFRPDLIAYRIYKDTTMQDYLAIINGIENSPEGFYRGRKLKIIDPSYKELI